MKMFQQLYCSCYHDKVEQLVLELEQVLPMGWARGRVQAQSVMPALVRVQVLADGQFLNYERACFFIQRCKTISYREAT